VQLDYKILFVDDEGFSDYMGELKDSIESYLVDMGFVLIGLEVNTREELESQISTDKNYDLIFVDNRFDDKECGIEFIKKIRDANIYADIILCTAQSDNDLIKNINVDTAPYGFYYFKKGPNLYQHACNVISFRFEKELDTNVMRGIAMSEVAKFDSYIHAILLRDDSHKQNILSKIKEKSKKRHEDVSNPDLEDKIWSKITNPETSTIYFESSMRKDFFHANVLKNITTLKECYNAIKDKYRDDVLDKRNILAHQIEPKISSEEIKQFRKELIVFRKIFEEINEHFNENVT